MGFKEKMKSKLGFSRQQQIKPVQRVQKPKRKGCKFRYKKKSDGYEVEFSSECKPEERAEILRQFKEREE